MDTKKLLEMLKLDLTRWSKESLVEAYNYCVDHMISMDQRTEVYAWWYDLREEINAEIEKRERNER